MLNILEDYFGEVLQSSHPLDFEMEAAMNCSCFCFSLENKLMLDTPFSEEEVEKALKDMGPKKAPSPSTFHAMFYKNIGILSNQVW